MSNTSSVKTMPVGFSGRCWYRIYTAQRCEGCLGMEAIRVAARGDQKGFSGVGSHTKGVDQGRCNCPAESSDFRLRATHLITELAVAAGK